VSRFHRGTPRASRREADLFYADLMGEPARVRLPSLGPSIVPLRRYSALVEPSEPAMPDRGDERFEEAVPSGGRGSFRHEPLGGIPGDNVAARWNVDAATTSGSAIHIVVHLHGFSLQADDANFLPRKTAAAGIDMVADDGTVRVRASRPTLALVPRGRHTSGATWVFDRLPDRAALDALIDAGLAWLGTTVLGLPSGSTLRRGQLTLAAHSGGGAGMSALLAKGVNPDELMCFDSMYGGEDSIRRWAIARIQSTDAPRSGLRVFYTGCSGPLEAHPGGRWVTGQRGTTYEPPGSWTYSSANRAWRLTTTELSARRLHDAIVRALAQASGGAALERRFRVQRTSITHNDIPAQYCPLLLENIAGDVPRASAPPASTSRPACVANDDWLTQPPRKPGGDDPPPPRPTAGSSTTEAFEAAEPYEDASIPAEDAYAPPNARAYTPSTNVSIFRTPPDPVAVASASQWPQPIADGNAAAERVLRGLGVTADRIRAFGAAGVKPLGPIAALFGESALTELFQRLRYNAIRLGRAPHSYDKEADLTHAFGKAVSRSAILAIRTLLAIPGHFRELARRAPNDDEAYAVENLGWLLMQSLATDVRTASGLDFWLPGSPAFVTAFPMAPPRMSAQVSQLIAARTLTDSQVDAAAYQARFTTWQSGAPGRMWRLETGRDQSTGRAAGAPFYSDPFTIPPSINITHERAQVRSAWARRLADFDAGRTTVPLTQCDNAYLTSLGLMSRMSLRGLQLRSLFPSPSTAATLTVLNGLAAVQPAFEVVFQVIADLGWNDLLFETQGMGCFRGKKVPGNPAVSRNMSEHSLGIAVDLNVFENPQNIAGSMDPRIVALFEAFRFRWGKGFTVPDPMHFEYAG
jgi:hypothetical protein